MNNDLHEMFSTKMLGDGFAVEPDEETVAAPMTGKIVMIPETRHAFGLKTKNGVEILVHVGVETVGLNENGFVALLKQGDMTSPLRWNAMDRR